MHAYIELGVQLLVAVHGGRETAELRREPLAFAPTLGRRLVQLRRLRPLRAENREESSAEKIALYYILIEYNTECTVLYNEQYSVHKQWADGVLIRYGADADMKLNGLV